MLRLAATHLSNTVIGCDNNYASQTFSDMFDFAEKVFSGKNFLLMF